MTSATVTWAAGGDFAAFVAGCPTDGAQALRESPATTVSMVKVVRVDN
jgi:hypothetical protein